MLDIDFIKANRDLVQRSAVNKNIKVDIGQLLKLDAERRSLIEQSNEKRRQRNEHANMLKESGPTSQDNIQKGKVLKTELQQIEQKLKQVEEEYGALLKIVPNIATEDTPVGKTAEDNQVVGEWGDKTNFDFEPKTHWDIAESKGWIDKERASKVSGARFAYIKGPLVLLQQAIISYTLKVLTDQAQLMTIIEQFNLKGASAEPFVPVLPPLLIRTEVFDAMDRLEPRDDRYQIAGEELWLQGSAEHVLGSMHMDEIIDEKNLPLRYVGFASSFRKEAGSYGKDLEGIIRMHQFDKLEMEILSTPETGLSEHYLTIAIQEYLLQSLNLPYHKLLKSTADIGKPNARGVDLEVWLPGHGKYLETHTADFMTDYQSRRLNSKVRREGGKTDFVHTIDATAFALGRTIIAILENFQTKEGEIMVPEALRPFMNGADKL